MTGRWWLWSGLALGLAIGCGKSSKVVVVPDDAGSAGEAPHAMTGDAGGSGGTSGEGGRDGGSAGGAGGAGEAGGVGAAGAGGSGEAGESGSSGTAGGGFTSCPPDDGEAGELNDVHWIGRPDLESDPPLCVPDCTSAEYAPAKREGCEWLCPATAPVRAKSCELRCDETVACGPGLYCQVGTQAFSNATESCIWLADDESSDSSCSCHQVPESCDAEEKRWLCGQDGRTYASFCEAHRARTDVVAYAYDADCILDDESFFKCGGIFCERGSEYCIFDEAHDDHDLDDFRCVTSPCASSGGCACVVAEIGREGERCTDTDPQAIIFEPAG